MSLWSRIVGFFYNIDIGLHESNRLDKVAADVLDKIQKDHVEHALSNAELLEQQETKE